MTNLELDAFVISQTLYEQKRWEVVDDDGPGSIEKFREAHILFLPGMMGAIP